MRLMLTTVILALLPLSESHQADEMIERILQLENLVERLSSDVKQTKEEFATLQLSTRHGDVGKENRDFTPEEAAREKRTVTQAANCSQVCRVDGECEAGWSRGPYSCFRYIRGPKANWDGANAHCRSLGGFLATLDTLPEIDWLHGFSILDPNQHYGYWIGAYQNVSSLAWMWRSLYGEDTAMIETDWAPNEPNNRHVPEGSGNDENCVAYHRNSYPEIDARLRWNDDKCGSSKSFMCEKSLRI